jgi:hypothetical protein
MAGALQDALDAYCLGLSWREAFSVAKQLQYSDGAISDLAYSLIGEWLQICKKITLVGKLM